MKLTLFRKLFSVLARENISFFLCIPKTKARSEQKEKKRKKKKEKIRTERNRTDIMAIGKRIDDFAVTTTTTTTRAATAAAAAAKSAATASGIKLFSGPIIPTSPRVYGASYS